MAGRRADPALGESIAGSGFPLAEGVEFVSDRLDDPSDHRRIVEEANHGDGVREALLRWSIAARGVFACALLDQIVEASSSNPAATRSCS
jgi:hypothetical protein